MITRISLLRRWGWYASVAGGLLLLLLAPRLAHLRGPIDNPHSWRQCDTAQYALAFYQNGIDLLAPSVNWMGSHKTLILEFPFPEMLMALAYRLFGYHLEVARIVTLLFFAGSTAYLFMIVGRFAGARLAAISAAVYLVMPLSLFYSRAIHVDFFAVFFAHAMAYHLMRAMEERTLVHFALGTAAASMAFLIKAPYAFYLFLPLAVLAAQRPSVRSFLVPSTALVAALATFSIWRIHTNTINSSAPDWSFIPGYIKFVDMGAWYYGALDMRWNPKVWMTILGRFREHVATSFGSILCLLGIALSGREGLKSSWRRAVLLWAWILGVLGYVAIFLNLNYIHDYYQIPLLAVTAVCIAIPIQRTLVWLRRWPVAGEIGSLTLLAAFAVGSFSVAERDFFKDEGIRVEAGGVIQKNSLPASLIVAAEDTRGTDCRDPRLLYQAQRYGWPISRRELTPDILKAYRNLGANHLAILTKSRADSSEIFGCTLVEYPLERQPWRVLLADLSHCRESGTRAEP